MAEILLTSEAFIKSVTPIDDNTAGKLILPALREAQEFGLRYIMGETLLGYIKGLIQAGTISQPANAIYKQAVDMSQYYLAYKTITEVAKKATYKIGNFGVAKATDENLQTATWDEIGKMVDYYQSKADAYCLDLQNWLLANKSSIPQLTTTQAYKIERNLYSSATCGIFLGGARGKGPYAKRYRR